MTHHAHIRRAIVLAAFSACILAAEISLTRIFSVIFWYHFGFLILSTAMLGFGFGGLIVRGLHRRLKDMEPDRILAHGMGIAGVSLAFSLFVLTHNHFFPEFVHQNLLHLARLALAALVLLPPFLAMGAVVLFMLQKWPEQAGSLYAANLAGSGLGCLLVLYLLDASGGLAAILLLVAAFPLLAGISAFATSRRAAAGWVLVALLLLLLIPAKASLFPLGSPVRKYASWAGMYDVVFQDWTSLSKVDIFKEKIGTDNPLLAGVGLWGLSARCKARLPERLGVVIDYWAYTTILKEKPDPDAYDFYECLPLYLAYKLVKNPETLIIGAGGGMDIRGALRSGARHIDAVEINPAIYRAMTEDLAPYSGHIYHHARVSAHLAEGRSFVESRKKTYDLIQLSGVDTYSASQAGAFALSENFLYTREAMATYLKHLSPKGVLTLTRWYMPSPEGLPRFSMRLFSLAVESLADAGIREPWKNILFVRSGLYTVILIKKSPFKHAEILKIEREAERWGYAFLFRPDRDTEESATFTGYIRTGDRERWLSDYPYLVSPPTDDSPFFFEHRKLRNIYKFTGFIDSQGVTAMDGQTVLMLLLLEMLLVAAGLFWVSRRMEPGGGRPAAWIYFACIGLGFMLTEVCYSQKLVLFLGHPVYALSVVLFSMLIFSGAGAMLHRRIARKIRIPRLLGALFLLLTLWALGGPALLRAGITLPFAFKTALSVLLIAPVAFLMGLALPEGLARLRDSGEEQFGVYWAWNGVASVTASVLSVILAIGEGFTLVLLLAAAAYLAAAFLLSAFAKEKTA